jgi:hypothetical protein
MSTARASLTTSQGVSAVIAGIIGHFLFSLAWFTLILGVLGLVARSVVFGLIDSTTEQVELTGEAGEGVVGVIETVRGVLGTLNLVLIISAGVSIIIAFLISGGIMKAGKVRKPFGATFSAMVIVAILDLGLFWLYLFIGLSASDETGFLPTYPIAFVLGTIVVGALVWLWMAHLRRAPLNEVEAAQAAPALDSTYGEHAERTADDAPVLDPNAAGTADAPALDSEAPTSTPPTSRADRSPE